MGNPVRALELLWDRLPEGIDWEFKSLQRFDVATRYDWQLTVTAPGLTLTVEVREDK